MARTTVSICSSWFAVASTTMSGPSAIGSSWSSLSEQRRNLHDHVPSWVETGHLQVHPHEHSTILSSVVARCSSTTRPAVSDA